MKNLCILALAAVALACVTVCAFACFGAPTGTACALVSAVGMSFLMKDTALKLTKTLPNGAATVNSTGLDLTTSSRADFMADVEFLLSSPVLTVGQLADASTIIYTIQHDTDPAFGTVADLLPAALTVTGAGGVGAAAATYRFRLPTTVKRYIRVKAVKIGAADASAASLTLEAQA